jgi:serine/threonine protein kinase
VLGGYEQIDHLATGGMGELFVARRRGPGGFARLVVIKRLRADLVGDERAALRLLDEARIAASLYHRNIAQVLDLGLDDGELCLVIEYVPGTDLARLLDVTRAALPFELAVTIIVEVARALAYAHARDEIVHRDVSPANVLLGERGEVKLSDFGVARARSRLYNTRSDTIKGKLGYIAPEQIRGEPVDARADVRALGVILYEATTGMPLFTADTEYETMRRVLAGDVPAPADPRYPAELLALIRRAVAADPAARFGSALELADALRELADARGWRISTRRLGAFVRAALGRDDG